MDEKEYLKLLKKGRSELPESVFEEVRFIVPKIIGMISGKRTVIKNLRKISTQLERKQEHIIKFLSKDLGTVISKEGDNFVIVGKFSNVLLNQKLDKYLKEFIYCGECSKPDSILIKEARLSFLKCNACGARRPVRSL